MGLERLSVAVRPRAGWEAIDLGFTMAREWWRQLWSVWLCFYVPAAVLLHVVFWDRMWVAMLLLWWLHPFFERAVMHVVGQAVFDVPPSLLQTLRATPQWRKPGLFTALSFYRLDPARSLMLPVWQLEQQRGRAARQRRKLLGKRLRGYGVWLTLLCNMFVYLLYRSVLIIPLLLKPAGADAEFDWNALFAQGRLDVWGWQNSLCLVIAFSIMQPFYVCGGFALYLNRRAALEGWDIEIALRKLAQRLTRVAAGFVLCVIIGASVFHAPALHAEERPSEAIKEILAQPEFNQYREGKRWEYRGPENKEEKDEKEPSEFWKELAETIARIAQVLAWLGAGIIVFLIGRAILRYTGWLRAKKVETYAPPEAMFGLDLTPDSLPDDVAEAAAQLAREGKLREALSLLYRGALSALVHAKQVRLSEGDTEGDCLQAARRALPGPGTQYFTLLVDAWRDTAYAKRLPASMQVENLCREWNMHFGASEKPA